MGNSARFSQGKLATTESSYPDISLCCMQHVLYDDIPPAVRCTLSQQVDMGSLTCAHIWVRAVYTHEGGSDTNTSAQELTRRDIYTNIVLTLSRQGIEPRDLNSGPLTTEPRPPSLIGEQVSNFNRGRSTSTSKLFCKIG